MTHKIRNIALANAPLYQPQLPVFERAQLPDRTIK
jgi:hypothetical protein